MARPLWFVKLLKKVFPTVKFIAKLTNFPILGTIFNHLLFRGDDIIYLHQDKLINVNKSIDEYQEYVLPSQVLEYFIAKANNHWIMNFCICRSSMNCKDYPKDLGCLFLGDAVLDINPQLGRKATKGEALEHLKKCREAGLVHMIGRNKLDAQWLGVSHGEKLLSICNCDPCCCLWRVSSILTPKIGSKIKKMPGIVVSVNDKCIGCGTCLEDVCFVNAISLKDKHAIISDQCRGCGRCVNICPQNAIELTLNDNQYIRKSIQEIDKIIEVG
ncbi:MAG: 4Fe-4S dicluster domain-containing protein [Promethearchaeota archaeon]